MDMAIGGAFVLVLYGIPIIIKPLSDPWIHKMSEVRKSKKEISKPTMSQDIAKETT